MENNKITTSRLLNLHRAKVYKAMTDPELLSQRRWPKWFTNEFEVCEVRDWWDWKFVMVWPDGQKYQNQSQFLLVSEDRIIIEHISQPHFVLTIGLDSEDENTKITRAMEFDNPEILQNIKHIIQPANEENLDRLEQVCKMIN